MYGNFDTALVQLLAFQIKYLIFAVGGLTLCRL